MEILEFYKDNQKLLDFAMISNRVLIGRSDSCDIALPDLSLSRLHCVLEKRKGIWVLTDRSRHGVFIDGHQKSKHPLKMGQSFQIASYTICLKSQSGISQMDTTKVSPVQNYEFVLESQEEYVVQRNQIVIIDGVDTGLEIPLQKGELKIGGRGCDIILQDPDLASPHCLIRMLEGRPMIQPAAGSVWVDGRKIQSMMPLYFSDDVRVANTTFRVQPFKSILTPTQQTFGKLHGQSEKMQRVFGRLTLFAGHDFPILITGESGTGKELAAHGIHEHSPRQSGPFIAINCASIPENLIESELFGYEKGAFTGSTTRYDGAFQQAHQGTLFLDELGELSLAAQAKILRVLENGEIRRVGAKHSEFPNVHIVAATNRDLQELVREGKFRADLLFRLQVLQVRMPPLKEHLEDLPELVSHYCAQFSSSCSITSEAMSCLKKHSWPGNVRELRNVLTRAYVLSGGLIDVPHIEFFDTTDLLPPVQQDLDTKRPSWNETSYLEELSQICHGNRSEMARKMGIPRSTLMYKLQKANLL